MDKCERKNPIVTAIMKIFFPHWMGESQKAKPIPMNPILVSTAGNPENQDRGFVVQDGARTVLCVADGAGGQSGGAEAASMAVDFVRQHIAALRDGESCVELLRAMDAAIAQSLTAGETTFVLAVATREKVFGASVGDSGCWLVGDAGTRDDLTISQQRKPFVGSGSAWPVAFEFPMEERAILLLATDGLLKYTSSERIVETCREQPIDSVAHRLVELVRYQSGALPDDVTVIVAPLFHSPTH